MARIVPFVAALLLLASPLAAQPPELPAPADTLNLLLNSSQAIVHAADMMSTAYALKLDARAREGNPILAPFQKQPVALALASGAIDVLQVWTISRLAPRHPKWAKAWATGLLAFEVWATRNNIRAANQLTREMR